MLKHLTAFGVLHWLWVTSVKPRVKAARARRAVVPEPETLVFVQYGSRIDLDSVMDDDWMDKPSKHSTSLAATMARMGVTERIVCR